MGTIELGRVAAGRAQGVLLGRGLRAATLAAVLVAAPVLARTAHAQRTGAIQATAYVIPSYLGAGVRLDSTATPVGPASRPVTQRLTIEGVGVVEIQTGADGQVPVTSRVVDRQSRKTLAILISYLGT